MCFQITKCMRNNHESYIFKSLKFLPSSRSTFNHLCDNVKLSQRFQFYMSIFCLLHPMSEPSWRNQDFFLNIKFSTPFIEAAKTSGDVEVISEDYHRKSVCLFRKA